jgi:hypothetical protein
MVTKKTTKKAKAPKATKGAKGAPTEKAEATKHAAKKPKANSSENKPKRVSAIDAAAQLLAASKEPMGCKEMIEAMAAKGLWTSPGGKTPAATLYSSIIREIATKGKDARFVKTERGRFAVNG